MKQDWTIFTRNYFAIFIATFGFFMNLYLLLPPIPLYADFIGVNEALIGLIVGSFTVTAAIARIVAGPYVNRWPKFVLALGSTVFILGPLFYILSDSPLELFLVRIFHGTGMVFTIATMTLVAKLTPKARLGEAIGIYGGFVGAAQVGGFFLSGIIIERWGYTGAFYVASGFALLSGLSAMLIKGDWISQDRQNKSTEGYQKVFADRNVRLASLGVVLLTFTYGVLLAYGPLYLQDIGLSPTYLGIFFALIAFGIMMGRPVAGWLSDKKGRIAVILPAMCLTAISIYFLSEFVAMNALFLTAILYGLGFGSAYSVQSALVIDTIDPQNRGSAIALFTACFDIGFSVGSIGIGFLAGIFLFEYSTIFQVTLILFSVGVGVFAYYSRQKTHLSTDPW